MYIITLYIMILYYYIIICICIFDKYAHLIHVVLMNNPVHATNTCKTENLHNT